MEHLKALLIFIKEEFDMKIFKTMLPIYGRLILGGVYTIDPTEKDKKLVPEPYWDLVAEWLADYIERTSKL